MHNSSQDQHGKFRVLDGIAPCFAALVIISATVAGKFAQIGPVTFPASAIAFPLTYLISDIGTEVYGYSRMRRIIWIGLFCNILAVLVYEAALLLPPARSSGNSEAYDAVLGHVPRITVAGWIAYFLGENANSAVLSIMKVKTEGRYLWARLIGSTIVGELIDTVIFLFLAFVGVMDFGLIVKSVAYLYVWKVVLEIALLPLTYGVIKKIKYWEKADVFDHGVNYNPFRI